MPQDATPQEGPVPTDARPVPQDASPNPQVRESIKYRRRAQDAERRAEALETELADLREGHEAALGDLRSELEAARGEAESLRGRLALADRDRQLERAFAGIGCTDLEAALALARQRLGGAPPEDAAAFARDLLQEKPHLAVPAADLVLPPRTAGARPSAPAGPHRAADRLADEARRTGRTTDVMAYMRARRASA